MLIILSSFVNIKKGSIPLTFILVALLYIGREVASGLLSNDNISQFTHIAGGVCGAVFGFTLKQIKG
jgi:rhomboid protease GluP